LKRNFLSEIPVAVTAVSRLRMAAGGNCGQQMSVKARGIAFFRDDLRQVWYQAGRQGLANTGRHKLGRCSESSSKDLTYEGQ